MRAATLSVYLCPFYVLTPHGSDTHRVSRLRVGHGSTMTGTRRFTGFLLLQNMLLKEFIREGLASRSLGPEEARRLSRLEAINAMELARWEKDLLGGGSGSSPGSSRERV